MEQLQGYADVMVERSVDTTKRWTDGETADVQDGMMTFLLAGHETTALTLTYVLDLLTRNPDATRALHDELGDVLDGKPAFGDLRDLTYTEGIVKEATRLYPPADEIRRQPTSDVTFGDYRVPEGSLIVLPTWVLHCDERFWDDPENSGRNAGRKALTGPSTPSSRLVVVHAAASASSSPRWRRNSSWLPSPGTGRSSGRTRNSTSRRR